LHAVVADEQLLLSFPLTPLTYQVVLANAAGAKARSKAKRSNLKQLNLMAAASLVKVDV
jgi:hypothetical protein